MARIFLANTTQGVGPLSLATSTCIRAAIKEIIPRSMLLAKIEGFPEDTLTAGTVLSLVKMACLNDEEWETTDEFELTPEMEVGFRELMRCVMEKLGGPGEMAAAMTKGEEGDEKALAEGS